MTSNVLKCSNCNIVICEVLAFVQNKLDVMDEESLVRVCTSGFSTEDIDAAKSLLFQAIPVRRKIPRKGDGKSQRNMNDIITLLKDIDPEEVPIFVAKDLQRLPPVTFDHIDTTRLLKDLLILQNEMKNLKQTCATKQELEILKNGLKHADTNVETSCISKHHHEHPNVNTKRGGGHLKSYCLDSGPMGLPHFSESSTSRASADASLHKDVCLSLSPVSDSGAAVSLTHSQSELVVSAQSMQNANNTESKTQFISESLTSKICKDNAEKNTSQNEWTVVEKKKPKNRFVGLKGTAINETSFRFRAADVKVPLFITNVDIQTTETDIVNYILNKTNSNVVVKQIQMKMQRDYKAYKVLVPRHKIDLFLNDHLWPEGVSFRKFIYIKNYTKVDNNRNSATMKSSVVNK